MNNIGLVLSKAFSYLTNYPYEIRDVLDCVDVIDYRESLLHYAFNIRGSVIQFSKQNKLVEEVADAIPNCGWGFICYMCANQVWNLEDAYRCDSVVFGRYFLGEHVDVLCPSFLKYNDGTEWCNNFKINKEEVNRRIGNI